mmetsp:Transcript_12179/g.28167  ORF Transcript_12179/g.28167 Transcript_12179/m.28167 type:complete len:259 (-) Transcript_12179:2136-2912(-)
MAGPGLGKPPPGSGTWLPKGEAPAAPPPPTDAAVDTDPGATTVFADARCLRVCTTDGRGGSCSAFFFLIFLLLSLSADAALDPKAAPAPTPGVLASPSPAVAAAAASSAAGAASAVVSTTRSSSSSSAASLSLSAALSGRTGLGVVRFTVPLRRRCSTRSRGTESRRCSEGLSRCSSATISSRGMSNPREQRATTSAWGFSGSISRSACLRSNMEMEVEAEESTGSGATGLPSLSLPPVELRLLACARALSAAITSSQ